MSGSITLASEVLRYLGRVRQNPASAVSPEEMEALELRARRDLEGSQVALISPAAQYTMLSRVALAVASDQSVADTIDTFGAPVEIVGFVPVIQQTAAGTVPPMSAFDVCISRTQGQRRLLTSLNQAPGTVQQSQGADFVSLESVSATVANRLLVYRIEEPQALLQFQYRWAVDAATRAALSYVDVQISLNIIYRLLGSDGRP